MDIFAAISTRRSIKRFTDRTISREAIEQLLDLAVQAPNHRMTEPWRFYVLGPEARATYGSALGVRKAKRVAEAEAAAAVLPLQRCPRKQQSLPCQAPPTSLFLTSAQC